MSRMVQCAKLQQSLPGLPYKPFADELGQRIYDTISQKAWSEWVEYSKKVVNESRFDLTSKETHQKLKQLCEQFLFGDAPLEQPPDYVPPKH